MEQNRAPFCLMTHESSIAIFGPGLLGGSLAMAVRKALPAAEIRIWARRQQAVDEVLQRKLADYASIDATSVVAGASLVILATPIEHMKGLSEGFVSALQPGAVVTDVGSVKRCLVDQLEPLFAVAGIAFVGSHPMAGSERAGLEAARADLFTGATCITTPTTTTNLSALLRVQAFWTQLYCRVLSMAPDEHDRKIARISHLPHAMASMLTLAALRRDPTAAQCSGNGFRDSTRIAAGDPELWTGILSENRQELISGLEDAVALTQELLAIVRSQDNERLRHFLAEAQLLRASVPSAAQNYGND